MEKPQNLSYLDSVNERGTMACNSTSCQSNCYRNEEQQEVELREKNWQDARTTMRTSIDANDQQNLCVKCKINVPISEFSEDGRFCADCFSNNLYGKFRLAVNSNAMITPSDKVLVAFSGGPSSRVALHFVHEMQQRAQKNFDASKDRSLPVFGVGIAFVVESAINSVPSDDMDQAIQDIKMIVSNLAPPTKELHVIPIESICSLDAIDGRDRLKNLLKSVNDATGKEDLLLYLRMLALQKVASKSGYNRLVLGSCTSRIACHVISATAKGQGYSLPADIQYVDARWEVPVVLPLRDCLAQELNMFCHLHGLKTIELRDGPGSGINALVSSFVRLLQEENPSRECTIVRTAGKLTPFHFNRIPEINDCNVPLATRRRQKRSNFKSNGPISSESFCPICYGPLNKSELLGLSSLDTSRSPDSFGAACCSSCQFQILPQDTLLVEKFYSLLPKSLIARLKHVNDDKFSSLRVQIQDCLLSDSEDET